MRGVSGGAGVLRGVVAMAAIVLAMVGCTSPIATSLTSVDPEGWTRGRSIAVELPNSDTLSLSDLRLVVRSDSRYDFDSLALTVSVEAPSGEQALFRTTLYGDPKAEHSFMQEWEQPLVSGARLAEEGNYTFRFTHSATRKVEGVWAIGITRE